MYSIATYLLRFFLRIAGIFKPGIREWNKLRKDHLSQAQNVKTKAKGRKVIWIHCASLGEFEQARSVIDALYDENRYYLILTFFSPSGYTIRKNYAKIHEVFYLPIDTPGIIKKFINYLNPSVYIGVKYEFWWNLFKNLNVLNIPKVLICLKMDGTEYFLQWSYFRNILINNSVLITQDAQTKTILSKYNAQVFKAGDSRVDSVLNRIKNIKIKEKSDKKSIVFGSIYEEDIKVILPYVKAHPDQYQYIFVPHNVTPEYVQKIEAQLPKGTVRFRQSTSTEKFVIIDEVGHLFDLYSEAYIVYIGGGFNKGIHNTLEPAVRSIPIAIGPKYQGFVEAETLVSKGAMTVVKHSNEFQTFMEMANQEDYRNYVAKTQRTYFDESAGATGKILGILHQILETK